MMNDKEFMMNILAQFGLGTKEEEKMKYTDLVFDEATKDLEDAIIERRTHFDGLARVFRFDNGYGASCVKHIGSYGGKKDLWEIAVIKFDDNDKWDLCYDTDITNDVIGWLDNDEVMSTLRQIKAL